MTSLKQYYKGIYYYTKAAIIYKNLRRYLKKNFEQDLNFPNQLKKDYFYHTNHYNRTKQYMHANHFFGELLCLLRGNTIQADERKRFANLSSCAPIFDDFFEQESNLIHIYQLLQNPKPAATKTDEESLAVHFLNNILQSINNKKQFIEAAKNLFEAQTDSKKQTREILSNDELLNISIRKGGYSGLMYALLLNHPHDEQFLKISFQLGSFGQLMDDVFDIYDDAQEGIRTFANQSKNISIIEQIIANQKEEILKSVELLPINEKKKNHFINVFLIFSSTIQIALNQYYNLETKQNIKINQCLKTPRKIWIVDMETPANIWQLFHLSVQKL